jgi:hypothetical protein
MQGCVIGEVPRRIEGKQLASGLGCAHVTDVFGVDSQDRLTLAAGMPEGQHL